MMYCDAEPPVAKDIAPGLETRRDTWYNEHTSSSLSRCNRVSNRRIQCLVKLRTYFQYISLGCSAKESSMARTKIDDDAAKCCIDTSKLQKHQQLEKEHFKIRRRSGKHGWESHEQTRITVGQIKFTVYLVIHRNCSIQILWPHSKFESRQQCTGTSIESFKLTFQRAPSSLLHQGKPRHD